MTTHSLPRRPRKASAPAHSVGTAWGYADPSHITMRRRILGNRCRETLYGYEEPEVLVRPSVNGKVGEWTTKKVIPQKWANFVGAMAKRRWLRYWEVRRVCCNIVGRSFTWTSPDGVRRKGTLGDIPEEWTQDPDSLRELDNAICIEWWGAMVNRAAALGRLQQRDLTKSEKIAVERLMWANEALFRGRCPKCGKDVREGDRCGHGFGRPRWAEWYGWEVDGSEPGEIGDRPPLGPGVRGDPQGGGGPPGSNGRSGRDRSRGNGR